MSSRTILLGLVVALAMTACGERVSDGGAAATVDEAGILDVHAVNYPLQYFAERIGGDAVRVAFPAPSDVDPAYWSPDAEIVAAYQQADLVLANGAGYAKWMERATLLRSSVIDTSAAFKERLVPIEDAVTHSHGPTGDHSHQGYAFTTWLDPTLAVEQARAILDAFVAARPQHEAAFRERFEALEKDLLEIDAALEVWAQNLAHTPLLFSHPVYQYLVARYGLNALFVHWEPGEVPGDEDWCELIRIRGEHEAGWMIWEGPPLPEIAERLRGLGVESVVLRPCATAPEQGDLLTALRADLQGLLDARRP